MSSCNVIPVKEISIKIHNKIINKSSQGFKQNEVKFEILCKGENTFLDRIVKHRLWQPITDQRIREGRDVFEGKSTAGTRATSTHAKSRICLEHGRAGRVDRVGGRNE